MTTIERLGNAARWAIAHPEPTVWRDGDVTYAPLMTVNPIIVLALLDAAEAARGLTVVHEDLHRRGDPEWEGWECDESNALRAALARLDGAL